jgi:uncharacterized protein (DUF427 family)
MKATLDGQTIADSNGTVSVRGYDYFPRADARLDLLEKSPKTPKDLECPHGVQFYDIVIGGKRHPRNAWQYETPQPRMSQAAGHFGFWKDVKVG